MVKVFVRELPGEDRTFHLDRSLKKRLMKVMRLRAGDNLEVFSQGNRYECRISGVLPDGIELQVIQELPVPTRSKIKLSLAQAIPKGERFEWLIQKGTELGLSEIVPIITERTITRPSQSQSRIQRWNEIADHAAGQSENVFPPWIQEPKSLSDYLKIPPPGLKLFLHEREGSKGLKELLRKQNPTEITFLVGPEGGWTASESEAVVNAGFEKIHLGSRILRSETAGLALVAIIQYELGDFSS
jgi:16S rRNA (uracil1498-N3)-methyltransferase